MFENLREFREEVLANGLVAQLFTIVGFVFAAFLIARLMSEKRAPANTFAWLLIIVLVPWVGVPLYLLLGGRKLRRLAERKSRLRPVPRDATPSAAIAFPTARIIAHNGAAPPVGGNHLRPLIAGDVVFDELQRQILEAKHTIHLMTFILWRDEVGQRIVELLARRAREGIKVRLLLDALGSFFSSRGFVDPLRRAGGEVCRFMPVLPLQTRWSANLRNHRKIAIFDHRVAMMGGHNIDRESMGPPTYRKRWRDFGAVIEGPAVRLLEEVFMADWAFASGQPIELLHRDDRGAEASAVAGESELQVVASGPDVPGDPLYEGIISMIQEAHRSVWLITPYFIPDEVLFRTLLLKARSGIDVRIVVPARSNHPVTDYARRHYLRELQAAGARVLLYTPGMNHAKLILTDERIGLMGSANFDLRSLFVNFEVGVVTYSPHDAALLSRWMQEVFALTRPMPVPRKRRSLVPSLGEELSRLLAPLL